MNHRIRQSPLFLYFSVSPVTTERSKLTQPHVEKQSIQASLMSLFDEPVVSDDAIRIYEQSVAVGHQGPFEPSDVDRLVYEEHAASLMISVRS